MTSPALFTMLHLTRFRDHDHLHPHHFASTIHSGGHDLLLTTRTLLVVAPVWWWCWEVSSCLNLNWHRNELIRDCRSCICGNTSWPPNILDPLKPVPNSKFSSSSPPPMSALSLVANLGHGALGSKYLRWKKNVRDSVACFVPAFDAMIALEPNGIDVSS